MGISRPFSPLGYPFPSYRSWWWMMIGLIFHGKSIASMIFAPFSQWDRRVLNSVSDISRFPCRISLLIPTRPMSWSRAPTTISSIVSVGSFISSAIERAYSMVMWELPPKKGSLISCSPTITSIVSIRHFFRRSMRSSGARTGAASDFAGPPSRRSSRTSLWSRMKSEKPNRRTSSELRIVVKEDRTTTWVFGETFVSFFLNSTPEKSGRNRSTSAQSIEEFATILSPSAPVPASTTWYPSSVKSLRSMSRTATSLLTISADRGAACGTVIWDPPGRRSRSSQGEPGAKTGSGWWERYPRGRGLPATFVPGPAGRPG